MTARGALACFAAIALLAGAGRAATAPVPPVSGHVDSPGLARLDAFVIAGPVRDVMPEFRLYDETATQQVTVHVVPGVVREPVGGMGPRDPRRHVL